MADDMNDQRHRRRLFGRRRGEAEPAEPTSSTSDADHPEGSSDPDSSSRADEGVATHAAFETTTPEPAAQPPAASSASAAASQPEPEPEPEPEPPLEPDPAPEREPDPQPEPSVAPAAEPAPEAEPATAAIPAPDAREPVGAPGAGERRDGEPPDGEPGDDEQELAAPLLLPTVIAIANQKGGVGKTTTAVNLGAALAELDFRVVVVDLDPQGNATTGLGVNAHDVEYSIYDVIMNDTPAMDAVEPTSLKNLFVIPATLDLAGAEIELVPAFSREQKLKRALDTIRDEYDIVIIDCPPSLGLLTVNGLAAADDVIVPIQCEYYALEGLGQLLRNVASVRSVLNPTLDVRGIVLTMHDTRTRLADQVETEVREHFGARVYRTVVPRTVRLAEAPSFGQPIIVFDPTSRGAKAYRKLAKEVSSGATRRTG
jgi:chromosome partitioning protein